MATSSLFPGSSAFFTLQWNEFCDLVSGGRWDQACSKWSFENLTEERRLALPHLARRFSESRQFLLTDSAETALPLEVLWLKLRLFAGLCSQVSAYYGEYHRPHLGLEPSKVCIVFPKASEPMFPARWDFFMSPLDPQEAATPFAYETMPPAFQANLFHPPHSLDSVFKAPEIREWPLGMSKECTVLLRSMEKIRTPEPVADQVRGIFQVHVMSDNLQGSSFSSHDVFCVKLPVPQQAHLGVNVWMARVESPERGIILRGQSEPMSMVAWEHIEAGKDKAFSKTPVSFFRSYSGASDAFSLGLLLFQALLGRDAETMSRLEHCLPTMVKGLKSASKGHDDRLWERGIDPRRLLFDEQGTLFNPGRVVNAELAGCVESHPLPHYLWYAVLELALDLVAREWSSEQSQENQSTDSSDPAYHMHMDEVLARVQTLGEWIRMELFSPHQRRREIVKACHKVRLEIG